MGRRSGDTLGAAPALSRGQIRMIFMSSLGKVPDQVRDGAARCFLVIVTPDDA